MKRELDKAADLAADTVRARATFAARGDYTNTGARIAGAAALVNHEGEAAARARLGKDSFLVDQVKNLEDHRKATNAATGATTQNRTATLAAAEATRQHARDMHAAHSAARGLASGFNAMWLTYGQVAPLLAGFALATGFKMAIEGFAQVQYQMQFVKSLSGEAEASVQGLTKQLHLASMALGIAPDEAAKGLRNLSQAGLGTQQAMQSLPDIFKLATVGELSVASAALAATGIMHAFGLSVGEIGKVGDVLAKAGAMSATSVSSMTESMKIASVVAQRYGVSLESTAVLLTALGKINITGTAAGTSVKNMITELYTPTSSTALRAVKELGISAYDKVTKESKNPLALIEEFRAALGKYGTQSQNLMEKLIFGEKGDKLIGSMLNLTKKQIDDMLAELHASAGFTSKVFRDLQTTTQGQFGLLKSTVLNTLSEIGEQGQEPLIKLMRAIREGFSSEQTRSNLTGLVQSITALGTAAVYVLPPVVALWGVMKTSALATAGVVALGSGLGLMGGAAVAATGSFGRLLQMVLGMNPFIRAISIVGTLAAGYFALTERKQSLIDQAKDETRSINDITAALEKENEQRRVKLIYEAKGQTKQEYDLTQVRDNGNLVGKNLERKVDDLQTRLAEAKVVGLAGQLGLGPYTAANLARSQSQRKAEGVQKELTDAQEALDAHRRAQARQNDAAQGAAGLSKQEYDAAEAARKAAYVKPLGTGTGVFNSDKPGSTGAEHRDALAAIRFRKEIFDDRARMESAQFAAEDAKLRARQTAGLITDEGYTSRQEALMLSHLAKMKAIADDGRTAIEKALKPNIKGTWEDARRLLQAAAEKDEDPKEVAKSLLSGEAKAKGFTAADLMAQVRSMKDATDKVSEEGVKLEGAIEASRIRLQGSAKKLSEGYSSDLFRAAEQQFEGLAKLNRKMSELRIGSANGAGPGAEQELYGKTFLSSRASTAQRQEEARQRFVDGLTQKQIQGAQKLGGQGAANSVMADMMAAYDSMAPLVRKLAEEEHLLNLQLATQISAFATLKQDGMNGPELANEAAGLQADIDSTRRRKQANAGATGEVLTGRSAYVDQVGKDSARIYEYQRTAEAGWKGFWDNYTAAATDNAKLVDNVMSQTFASLEQGSMKFATTGKLHFKSFASSVLADAARMYANQAFRQLLGMAGQFAMSMFTPTVTGATGDFARMDRIPAPGPLATGTNYVPFDGFLATLHKGEAVVPAAYNPMADGGRTSTSAGGGGDTNVSVQVFMDSSGNSRVESDTSAEKAAQWGALVEATFTSMIIKEKRPGGLLYPA